ncbi:MAG: HNH endonuclease [Methanomassiliicoccus sp.]|nr:HNH endonuclease [Methanomassiliicoccus sp.]
MEAEHEGMVLLDRILESNPTWSPRGSRVDPYMGVDEWIRSWMWRHIRNYVLQRDGHTCQICGDDAHEVQVHHIVWKSHNGSDHPKNLMVVCENCHRQIHAKQLPLNMLQ